MASVTFRLMRCSASVLAWADISTTAEFHRVFRGPADPLQPLALLHADRPDAHTGSTSPVRLQDQMLETACCPTTRRSITWPRLRDKPLAHPAHRLPVKGTKGFVVPHRRWNVERTIG
ncbi:hypothetical protein AQJ27_45290 [Streptomyces olivochromogenes]|nr:hypothetical protein AQJ27_45290 [Streptomyces olivochromogenes]